MRYTQASGAVHSGMGKGGGSVAAGRWREQPLPAHPARSCRWALAISWSSSIGAAAGCPQGLRGSCTVQQVGAARWGRAGWKRCTARRRKGEDEERAKRKKVRKGPPAARPRSSSSTSVVSMTLTATVVPFQLPRYTCRYSGGAAQRAPAPAYRSGSSLPGCGAWHAWRGALDWSRGRLWHAGRASRGRRQLPTVPPHPTVQLPAARCGQGQAPGLL